MSTDSDLTRRNESTCLWIIYSFEDEANKMNEAVNEELMRSSTNYNEICDIDPIKMRKNSKSCENKKMSNFKTKYSKSFEQNGSTYELDQIIISGLNLCINLLL